MGLPNERIFLRWNVQQLRTLKPDGVLINSDPAPIATEPLKHLLTMLSEHPAYEHQTVIVTSSSGTELRLVDGVIYA